MPKCLSKCLPKCLSSRCELALQSRTGPCRDPSLASPTISCNWPRSEIKESKDLLQKYWNPPVHSSGVSGFFHQASQPSRFLSTVGHQGWVGRCSRLRPVFQLSLSLVSDAWLLVNSHLYSQWLLPNHVLTYMQCAEHWSNILLVTIMAMTWS